MTLPNSTRGPENRSKIDSADADRRSGDDASIGEIARDIGKEAAKGAIGKLIDKLFAAIGKRFKRRKNAKPDAPADAPADVGQKSDPHA